MQNLLQIQLQNHTLHDGLYENAPHVIRRQKATATFFLTFSDQQLHYQHTTIKTPGPAFPHKTLPAPNTKIREEILQHSIASDPGDNSQLSLAPH